jgi:hypothetical protein
MINIVITADPDKPRDCRPAALLRELLAADRLANFAKAAAKYEIGGLGICHETSVALMVDLTLAGCAGGLYWASGDIRHFALGGTRKHSWLEVDGWALDFLGGTLLFSEHWWGTAAFTRPGTSSCAMSGQPLAGCSSGVTRP